MKISRKDWQKYITLLRKVSNTAADKVAKYINTIDIDSEEGIRALLDYSYAVATKYGEGATALACQMYDEIASLSGASVPIAEPAATATYGEVAMSVRGKMMDTLNPDAIGAKVGLLVRRAGMDTTLHNAIRDGAEWAWIPSGDTCPFCLVLASNGWQKASSKVLKGNHADHIHANCDCSFVVRFDNRMDVEGYDPEALYDEYMGAAGGNSTAKINALRRRHYAANKDKINTQKRAAYARRKSWTDRGENGIIPLEGKLLEALTIEDFCNILQDNPKELGNYNPITFKREMENRGAEVRPLGRGRHKGQSFEEGGGYIINYGGNGAIEYHPAKQSRHGGRYYRLSDSKHGRRWFDTKGNEFDPKAR